MGNAADQDLADQLARGLPEARDRVLTALMERYRDKVRRLAYAHLGSLSAAEEAAQETFFRVWRALPDYDGRASLSTWLYAITRNTCLSERRRRAARLPEGVDPASGSEPEGVESAERENARLDAERLLAQLPEASARVMRLFYLEEQGVEEVAAMLGMPTGTVKAHLHRSRKRLAQLTGATAETAGEAA